MLRLSVFVLLLECLLDCPATGTDEQNTRANRDKQVAQQTRWARHGAAFTDTSSKAKMCRVDRPLALQLAFFLLTDGARSVMDLGCACGDYVQILNAAGLRSKGVDLHPKAPEGFKHLCSVGDVSKPLIGDGIYDWALALGVAERIPDFFEAEFLQNVYRHGARGAIISWSSRMQPGVGRVNLRDATELMQIFGQLGYRYDNESSENLRRYAGLKTAADSCCGHFKESLYIFRRIQSSFAVLTPKWADLPETLESTTETSCNALGFSFEGVNGVGTSCASCQYMRMPFISPSRSEVLWVLSASTPLDWAMRLCCAEGHDRCSGYEIDPVTEERRLLRRVHHPSMLVPISDFSGAASETAGLYIKHTQNGREFQRGEPPHCQNPADNAQSSGTDDGAQFMCITGYSDAASAKVAHLREQCFDAFDSGPWKDLGGVPSTQRGMMEEIANRCVSQGGDYLIFEASLTSNQELFNRQVYKSLKERFSMLTNEQLAELESYGVCVPRPPICEAKLDVEMAWRFLTRHVLLLEGSVPVPKNCRVELRLGTEASVAQAAKDGFKRKAF